MLARRLKRIAGAAVVTVILALALVAAVGKTASLYVSAHAKQPIYSRVEDVPGGRTAIVLGAGLAKDGTCNSQLRERLDAAVELYRSGKTNKLIVSGNCATKRGDEPGQMRDYLVVRGVPRQAIVIDPAGVRTYESMYRAGHVYGLTKALIVTHRYHLFRSLFLADQMGLDAVGFAADVPGESYWRSEVREPFACLKALVDIHLGRPHPSRKDSAAPAMN